MSSKKKTPEFFLQLLQRLSKIISLLFLSFTSVITQDLQQWNEDTQRILRIHGHAEFFFIFVSLFCLLQKKKNVGTERSPHQPNDNNITQNKGSNFIHHSIIYCEERDKIQKKPIQYIGWFIRNNSHWALYQQKSCNIACPAEITIHIQIPMGFPPLSPSFSLYYTHHNSLFSLTLVQCYGKTGPQTLIAG